MAKRIPLSFKDNPRDTKIYEEIKRHSDYSAYIKDALYYYINNVKTVASTEERQAAVGKDDIADIDDGIMDIIKG